MLNIDKTNINIILKIINFYKYKLEKYKILLKIKY